ncbi:MAG: M42 family peptidase [Bacillota bacterium]|nr:M42 family peptidase [Bacillota bacterium]
MNLKTLKELCELRGTSGNESVISNFIITQIKDFDIQYHIDNLGNLIVFKKGKERAKTKLLLSAHMDEVGFIVSYITDDGFVKFAEVGGIDQRVVFGRSVKIGKNEVSGVVIVKPVHLLSTDEKTSVPKVDEMLIDIGAQNRDEAQKVISLGDQITFDSEFDCFEDRIISKALDDRVGCMMLIDMIRSDLPYDMYFSFVVQEEVGLRGAKVAAYSVDPEAAIVVEATTAADIPTVSEENQVCKINDGAVISFMDKSTIYNKEFYELAFQCAKDLNVKAQTKSTIAGGNDSGTIHINRSGVKTIAVSVPCRYLHSASCLMAVEDIVSTEKIVNELAIKIAG